MKRLIIAATVSLVALGAVAYAQSPGAGPGQRGERWQERMERRAERMEERGARRLERLKADLRLTPQQEPLWAPIETQLRNMQAERRSFRQANAARMRNAELPDRLDMMSQRMAQGAGSMRQLSDAIKPLWATLSAEQKETVRKAMPGRGRGMGPGDGPRGDRRG